MRFPDERAGSMLLSAQADRIGPDRDPVRRRRHRHERRRPAPRLRAVLHDPAQPRRHRPRPAYRLQSGHPPAAAAGCGCNRQLGRGTTLPDPVAAGRARGRHAATVAGRLIDANRHDRRQRYHPLRRRGADAAPAAGSRRGRWPSSTTIRRCTRARALRSTTTTSTARASRSSRPTPPTRDASCCAATPTSPSSCSTW